MGSAEQSENFEAEGLAAESLTLRNPLVTPRAETEEGSRHIEATQFAEQLTTIVSDWSVHDEGKVRRATYADIMVLVRSRTHLAVYEEALRARHIPFISSRRGGLLDTLEAEDLQALLMFFITPFADLALAQVLRSPIFGCSDADLISLAQSTPPTFGEEGLKSSWWQRLQHLASNSLPSRGRDGEGEPSSLQRAHELLNRWLALADKLPVHDLLDRIYFEGEVIARYSAVLPIEMRAKVSANLHAFMKMALNIDAGRYPSLPRFLQDLRELRDSNDDAPDEGKLGLAGDAVRIYTVHESKGLEAPIVWLLDANAENKHKEGNDVLLDWPTHEPQPLHFSLYTDQASRGKKRAALFELDAAQQAREEMNLLYVAMTRAKQALIVSGNSKGQDKEEKKKSPSWYDRIAAALGEQMNSLHTAHSPDEASAVFVGRDCACVVGALAPYNHGLPLAGASRQQPYEASLGSVGRDSSRQLTKNVGMNPDLPEHRPELNSMDGSLKRMTEVALPAILPTGQRNPRNTEQQQRGIWLHALLQNLTETNSLSLRGRAGEGEHTSPQRTDLQSRLGIPSDEIEPLYQQAQHLLSAPHLARFFDATSYLNAYNEMPYINTQGELKRIDRLVEFDKEIWVLDYKLGDSEDSARHQTQMREYQTAMQSVYVGKSVRSALVFADGVLNEM